MIGYVELSYIDLALASVLVLITGGISIAYNLGIERSLAISAARMIVQLMAVGFILRFVFAQTSPLWTVLLGLMMALWAGREIVARQSRKLDFWTSYGFSTGVILAVSTAATILCVGALIRPDPWYKPQYILPILGMLLGNTMTGISLALDSMTSTAWRDRAAIEARIALGAPRFEAFQPTLRSALKVGLMPIINAMAAAGLVSLPGMMTGQILSGVEPVQATKYQILIMFFIAGSTALGVLLASIGGVYLLTDTRARLRLDRLQKVS